MRGLRRALSGKASEETVNNIFKRKRIFQPHANKVRTYWKLGVRRSPRIRF